MCCRQPDFLKQGTTVHQRDDGVVCNARHLHRAEHAQLGAVAADGVDDLSRDVDTSRLTAARPADDSDEPVRSQRYR